MAWQRPSDRVAELWRGAVERLLEAPDELLDQLDEAILAAAESAAAEDPGLVAAIRRSNRANLVHWTEANLRDPGGPVAANLGPETMVIARDLVRRGLDETVLQSYRVGQNIAWSLWMSICFAATSDPSELHELLHASAESMFGFVDSTVAGIAGQMRLERDELTRGTHAERLEVVTLILEGARITRERAATRLGYELDGGHTAAIVWTDDPDPDQGELESAAQALADASGTRRALNVIAGAATRWIWVAGAGPDVPRLELALAGMSGLRVALGTTATGVDGFRRSHLEASATQRLLIRTASRLRFAAYEDVQVVALVTQDPQRAQEFVTQTLGELAHASLELRETVRTYLQEQSNATSTAALLFTHRNTVLSRLARAEQLLPRPLAGSALRVGLALEVLHWQGANA